MQTPWSQYSGQGYYPQSLPPQSPLSRNLQVFQRVPARLLINIQLRRLANLKIGDQVDVELNPAGEINLMHGINIVQKNARENVHFTFL